MKTWEVIIPPAGGGTLQTLIIEAATSMMALSEGLRQLSDPAQLSSLMCKILPHGTLEVVDNRGGRTITIRELDAAALAEQTEAAPIPEAQPQVQAPGSGVAATAPPAAVPPPDPGSAGEQSASTAVGMQALGDPAPPADGRAVRKRRQTQELISTASGMSAGEATPPPGPAGPPVAAPPVAAPPVAGPPVAGPPVASPPVAKPPAAAPPSSPKRPPDVEITGNDPLRSSGEVMGMSAEPRKPITEPAIIIDDHLQEEIEQLENLRKAREVAMTPPAMRPIPHKVFKVLAEAAEAPRFETVRRRYVSVWPNPPQDALEEVLQIQIAQVRGELEQVTGAKRVLVAAFDHAFEKVPLRPPMGLCTWNTSGPEDPAPAFAYGETAAELWAPAQTSTGSDHSPTTAPAPDPNATALGRPEGPPAEDVKTALMASVDADGNPVTAADMGAPMPAPEPAPESSAPPTAGAPPVAAPPAGAAIPPPTAPPTAAAPPPTSQQPTADPAGSIPSAPAPVQYPAELQAGVYDASQPAPPPDPPTGTLDPFYPSAHADAPDGPPPAAGTVETPSAPGAESMDLMSQAFQRFQPLFYVTDRQQAFAFAIDTAMGLVPSQAGVLHLYDYQAGDLYSAIIRAPGGAQIPGYRTTIADGVAGFCATQGLPLALSQGDQDARFSSVLGTQCGLQVYTLAGVPLQYQGRLYGVLELANRQAAGAYSTEEINALAYIGRQLAERLSTTLSTQMPAVQDPSEPQT